MYLMLFFLLLLWHFSQYISVKTYNYYHFHNKRAKASQMKEVYLNIL